MNIILLGPPGAGKGTQARGWKRSAGWSSCRPATCCARRWRRARRSGIQAKAVMDAGELVSDAIVSALIGERLDGRERARRRSSTAIPRTRAQAEALDLLLERARAHARPCDRARGRRGRAGRAHHRPLQLRASAARPITTSTSCRRSRTPATCAAATNSSGAPTTMKQTVRKRLAEYRAKTAPILPYYEERGTRQPGRRHGQRRRSRGPDRRDPRRARAQLAPA